MSARIFPGKREEDMRPWIMVTTLGFIKALWAESSPLLAGVCLRGNRYRSHKSFGAEFLDVFTHCPVIEPDLLGDVEDRVLALEAHHDLFDGAVEGPVLAPVYPEPMPTEIDGAAERALRHVVAGIDADDLPGNLRRAGEHIFVNDIQVIVGG